MTKQEHTDRPPYPLAENAQGVVSSTGKPVSALSLEGVRSGAVGPEDFGIHADTLRAQAKVAAEAGFTQLADNFYRAAELTNMPQEKVLMIYEALRPYRLKHDQLLALAQEIERDYGATENARFIREAAQVYKSRGLV